jgi:hypothetical protein
VLCLWRFDCVPRALAPSSASSSPAKSPRTEPAKEADNKIGGVDDILIDKEGRVTAVIIGVGGFLGMGEKDVAVPFSSVRASEKNNKW